MGNNRTGSRRQSDSAPSHRHCRGTAFNATAFLGTVSQTTGMDPPCTATTVAAVPTGKGVPIGDEAAEGARRVGGETTIATATPTVVRATLMTVKTRTTIGGGASGGAGEVAGDAVAKEIGGGAEETETRRVAAPRAAAPRTRTREEVVMERRGGMAIRSQVDLAPKKSTARIHFVGISSLG